MSLAGVSFGFSLGGGGGHFARYSSFFLFFLFCVHVHFEEMAFYLAMIKTNCIRGKVM